ncbi:unnamed protein product, partial [Mesorhabditis belari]|uniref:Seven TM Receptor n=1 Tax=Mesorhabditis belari TaxID=2138241 RepID=A0AAF3ECG0_9BILA
MGFWIQFIMYANGFCAYATNSLLIYVILKHSRPELGSYRYLMLSFTICNIIFPTLHMLVMPHLHVIGHAFIFFPEGILAQWPIVAHWADVGWGFMFGVILAVVMLHFIYRYLAVVRPRALIFFSSQRHALLPASVVLFNGLVWGASFHCSTFHIDKHKDYFRESMMKDYGVSVDGLPMLGLLFVTNNSLGQEVYYWPEVFSGVCCMTLFFGTFLTISCCTVGIYYHLEKAELSAKTKKLQKELFKALICQASIPCMLEYGPCGFTHLLAFSGINLLGPLTHYCIIFVSLYPAIDPLCVMYFIKDYRRFIARKLGIKMEQQASSLWERSQNMSQKNSSWTRKGSTISDLPPIRGKVFPAQ